VSLSGLAIGRSRCSKRALGDRLPVGGEERVIV
jgi:hypothetical protein